MKGPILVNIKDFELDKEALWVLYQTRYFNNDRLAAVFARQGELMLRYHPIEEAQGAVTPALDLCGKIDNRQVQMRIKDMMWRCVEELGEAANCLKNKPWKQDAQPTDQEHFYEEIADAFHFFVEMCMWAGINADTLFNLYFRKSEVNKFRQRSGY